MDRDCIFCNIISGKFDSKTLYETKEAKIILDKFPSSLGHCLIVSKEHFRDIYEVDETVYANMMKEAVNIAKTLKKVLKCDGVNILQNNEEVAGQSVFHLHIHVIPRYKDDDVTIKWKTSEVSDDEVDKFSLEFDKERVR